MGGILRSRTPCVPEGTKGLCGTDKSGDSLTPMTHMYVKFS